MAGSGVAVGRLTRHYSQNPADMLELLFRRNGYTAAQLAALDRLDCAYLHKRVDLETYLQLLQWERNRRQAQCDGVAAELLATVNLGD